MYSIVLMRILESRSVQALSLTRKCAMSFSICVIFGKMKASTESPRQVKTFSSISSERLTSPFSMLCICRRETPASSARFCWVQPRLSRSFAIASPISLSVSSIVDHLDNILQVPHFLLNAVQVRKNTQNNAYFKGGISGIIYKMLLDSFQKREYPNILVTNKRHEKGNSEMRSIERIMPSNRGLFLRSILRCRRLKGIGHAALPVASVWYCS